MVALALGCGGSKSNPCERINTMCHAGFDGDDLKDCTAQLPDVIGKGWDDFVTCSSKAGSCGEVLACAAGSLDERGRSLLSQLARGHDAGSTGHRSADTALPPECARANDVCADDEPFARRECTRMVGNLKADPENKAKLAACFAAARNCFAFQKCTDQMWADLH